MKQIFLLITLSFGILASAQYQMKEVQFDWLSPSVIWAGAAESAPCLEPFYLKIKNLPEDRDTSSQVYVNLYESEGEKYDEITKKEKRMAVFTGAWVSSNEYSVLISQKLKYRRYYYIEVVYYKGDAKDPKVRTARAYAAPLKTETAFVEFYGGLGTAMFSKQNFSEPKFNFGIATGIKLKVRSVSTNSNISRYAYGNLSRVSLILGTVVNDLYYENYQIESLVVGLKPLVALDFEFTKHFALTIGSVFGNQETGSRLTITKNPVAGLWIGASFSADVFNQFNQNIPQSPINTDNK